MIAFVNGIVEDYSEEAVILDVNGIGYEIKISGDTSSTSVHRRADEAVYLYLCKGGCFLPVWFPYKR